MAVKKKSTGVSASVLYKSKPKVSRPGIHAKTKMSKLKNSKNYHKSKVGQG